MTAVRDRLLRLLQRRKEEFEAAWRGVECHPLTRKPLKEGDLVDAFPPGATAGQVDSFAQRMGIQISESLRDWLSLTNGAAGFYGVPPVPDGRNIARVWGHHPKWQERSWIPVADDGFGNYYVQPNSDPVCFVEILHSDEDVAYVVASNMLHFAVFFLEAEFGIQREEAKSKFGITQRCPWPFSKRYTLSKDTGLRNVKGLPMPWET